MLSSVDELHLHRIHSSAVHRDLGECAFDVTKIVRRQLDLPQVRAAMRCNKRVEQAHQPTRVRQRVMRRFKSVGSAQRFLKAFSRVGNPFRPRRHLHLVRAAAYRAVMRERAATWRHTARLQAA